MTSKQVCPFEARSQDLRGCIPVAGAKVLAADAAFGLILVHPVDDPLD